ARLRADGKPPVLRLFGRVGASSGADDLSPELLALGEPFHKQLGLAYDEALEKLDELERQMRVAQLQVERGAGRDVRAPTEAAPHPVSPATVVIDLKLSRRTVSTEAEVAALVDEIRETLMAEISAGKRVRLK
ncbi:MAG: hypothetical protein JNJ59_25115, partial [Deltaproteobacteria bacterium]|nr:hypothetical protein [Deltaproteobacteria bacterium]